MKLKFEISELALEDLDNIWEFTVEQWSKEQANIYYNEIFSAIGKICENSDIGKPIDEIKKDTGELSDISYDYLQSKRNKIYRQNIASKKDIEKHLNE